MARPHPSRTGGPGHRVAAEQGGADTLEPFLYASISDLKFENARDRLNCTSIATLIFIGTMNSLSFIICTRRLVLHPP